MSMDMNGFAGRNKGREKGYGNETGSYSFGTENPRAMKRCNRFLELHLNSDFNDAVRGNLEELRCIARVA